MKESLGQGKIGGKNLFLVLFLFFFYLYRTYSFYNFKFDPKIYLFYILATMRERKLVNVKIINLGYQ